MIILSFIRRYAPLLIVFVLFVALSHVDEVTYFVGPIFYLAELTLGAAVCGLFIRHLFMRRTLDAYSVDPPNGDSDFVQEWRKLEPRFRVMLSIVVLLVLYLGACYIAGNIAK